MFASLDLYRSGMYGLIVGDALGVPVEFTDRVERDNDPVRNMRAYGTHNQPAGTWSDDSSMALATLDSIAEKKTVDYKDIMERYCNWCMYGDYTPFGELFDIGNATVMAIKKYGRGAEPLEAGGKNEWDNGNGSLMRILPACIYLYDKQKAVCTSEDENIYVIHNISALTHAHLRSQIACGIYYFMVKAVIEREGSLLARLQSGIDAAYTYYCRDFGNNKELSNYDRLVDLKKFKDIPKHEIRSSGYVVHTLEAAVWCLIHSDSYEEAVLAAVNLGEDTDTVGAVTGGLAGLYYGFEAIPKKWIDIIQQRSLIDGILDRLLCL